MAPKESDVPQPGPARLSKGAGPDEWLEQAKTCKYLPEADMKRLCEIVKECLMEGTSIDVVKLGDIQAVVCPACARVCIQRKLD
jgi:serine/threonine-protein phosphatase PP1-1